MADILQLAPRYNVAPRQVVAVVGLNGTGERRVGLLTWGLLLVVCHTVELGSFALVVSGIMAATTEGWAMRKK